MNDTAERGREPRNDADARMLDAAETCRSLGAQIHAEHQPRPCGLTCKAYDWAAMVFYHWGDPMIGHDDLQAAQMILKTGRPM